MKKISFRDHLRHLYQLLIMMFLAVAAIWFFPNYEDKAIPIDYVLLLLPFVILLFIPTLIIHLNYYSINKSDFIYFDSSYIKFKRDNKEYIIDSSSTDKIEYHLSHAIFDKRFLWLPWDYYRHIVVYLKDGTSITVTSLLIYDNEFDFIYEHNFEIVIHKSFFRLA